MNAQEFFDQYNNQGVDYDGYYGYQCMDLANQYNRDVVGAPTLIGNAVDVWTTYPHNYYDKIENTPDGVPQVGDIVIWGQGIGQYGHIAVFHDGNTNAFTSFDQNWPINSVCHYQQHNYNNVLGWLRPKQTPTTPPAMNDQTIIPAILNGSGQDLEIQAIRGLLADGRRDKLDLLNTQAELMVIKENVDNLSDQVTDLQKQLTECQNQPPVVNPTPVFKTKIASLLYQLAQQFG